MKRQPQKPRYTLKRHVERIKRRNNIIFFLIILCVSMYLMGAIIFGDKGLIKYSKLQETKKSLQNDIVQLERDNQRIKAEVKALREDPYYIEKHAREEFGLARPGEYIFQFQQNSE